MTRLIILIILIIPLNLRAEEDINKKFKDDYAQIAFLNYFDAFKDAQDLHIKIIDFLKNTNESNFALVKEQWLKSRISYGQSEAFGFYGDPKDRNTKNLEVSINGWPIDPTLIDYTKENPNSGIINDPKIIRVSKSYLINNNQKGGPLKITLGYHIIEFLLWGQDLSFETTGRRPVSDYYENENNEKRRKYLDLSSTILTNNLGYLANQWQNNRNYAKRFIKMDDKTAQKNVLTILATLSSSKMASKRMEEILNNEENKENELLAFSDNTYNDFIYNQQGILNVFLGDYKNFQGIGIYELIAKKNSELADKILNHINQTAQLIAELPNPIDAKIINTEADGEGRIKMEEVILALKEQAQLFLEAVRELENKN